MFILSWLQVSMTSFFWESLSTLTSRYGCTQVYIDPAGYFFRARKNIRTLHLVYFSKWNQKPDSLLLHISNCWKNGLVSRPRLFRWEFPLRKWKLCVSPSQVRNPLRTQLFSQLVILNISHYVFHIHISCSWSGLQSVLSVSMLT